MGCITSSQKDVDATPTGAVKALSVDMKTRFANVDPDVLGDYKEEAEAKLAFVYGRAANIFIITTPPFSQPQQHEYTVEQAANGDDAERHAEDAEARDAAKEAKQVKEVRWTVFNDSKEDAKIESTFFHAEALRRAGSEESVKMERSETGMVKASVTVPAGATVAFVEGPIKGYMYKCFVHEPKTNSFELAAPAQ